MAEELKDINDKSQPVTAVKTEERSDRTKERIEDLIGKVKTFSEDSEAKGKRISELEFELNFERLSKKYPNAPELRDNIKKAVDSGIPLDTAAIAELHKANKLMTSEQINSNNAINDAVGGSADTKGVTKETKTSKDMTSAERRARLLELEEQGEVRLAP